MRKLAVFAALIGVVTACQRPRLVTGADDGGAACPDEQRLVNGACQLVCTRDGECASGERCDLLLGTCVPKAALIDAGSRIVPCTNGALRCSLDNLSVQRCQPDGGFELETTCPSPNGFCEDGECLACRPGSTHCLSASTVDVCDAQGSAFTTVTCAASATCTADECRACVPGATRCSPDGKAFQECQSQPNNPASATTWVNAGDNFDGLCITQQCIVGSNGAACTTPACVPGATQCKNSTTAQVCSPLGAFEDTVCSTLPGFGPTSECIGGTCVDECGDAVRAKSYFGCEYWAANLDNDVDAFFKGKTMSGQGTADSDYVFVVTNQSSTPATVTVQRHFGGNVVTVKTVTVPGRTDPATKGLVKINVPWQALTPADSDRALRGDTARGLTAYHLVSTKPITVYQFNPVDALKVSSKSCSTVSASGQVDCSCNELASYPGSFNCSFGQGYTGNTGSCVATTTGNKCAYYTFTNDASLLLPAHILGLSHVVLAPPSWRVNGGAEHATYPGQFAVLATADNTQVTIKSSAATAASVGGAIAAMAKDEVKVFTLNAYEVLQVSQSDSNGQDCRANGTRSYCRIADDLTGSIVTSDKPVAVFGGSPCAQIPYDKPACDHVEEQLFPFSTWGKSFVMVPPNPLRLTTGGASGAPPAHYKIVAGCPASQCMTGTLITLSPPPAAGDVITANCATGSLPANTCRLVGASFVEFKATRAFTAVADQPISVAQFLTGQQATTTSSVQGDPSMILLPPVEQWRSRYTVLASTGLQDNFLGLAIDSSRVAAVLVDGAPISGFQTIGSSTFQYKNHPVSSGTHTIQVNPAPNQMTLPGAGVTIYGYDSYVSYGYTGGLDLGTLVTGTNPGG